MTTQPTLTDGLALLASAHSCGSKCIQAPRYPPTVSWELLHDATEVETGESNNLSLSEEFIFQSNGTRTRQNL